MISGNLECFKQLMYIKIIDVHVYKWSIEKVSKFTAQLYVLMTVGYSNKDMEPIHEIYAWN